MLFIAQSTIEVSEYMVEETKSYHEIQIIEAKDSNQAHAKLHEYWSVKSDEFGTYYVVKNASINKIIL